MSTSLFDAPPYDPRRARRKKHVITVVITSVLVLAALAYIYRNWAEERVVDKFFAALQRQDYETAYGIWMNDPAWKQHPQKYGQYPFGEFYRDWGPGGEWGVVRSYKIDGSGSPRGGGSGVIVQVTVNNRAEKARIWVEKKDKTLTFSPY
ncbi:MAG TPA: hypothetical protein VGQ71_02480 [Terriglobales bacterium]|jgi:hypothetical protein|nr:hypothetical protein [Terriglobales bacterium]